MADDDNEDDIPIAHEFEALNLSPFKFWQLLNVKLLIKER